MLEFGFVDARKPTSKQNDYRTSTYRAHVPLMEQISSINAGPLTNVCNRFAKGVDCMDSDKSEVKEKFTWKPGDPTVVRNPTVTNLKHIKPYENVYFQNAPKPLKPPSSSFKQDYQFKPQAYEEKPPVLGMRTAVAPNKALVIHRGKPGYARYLDPCSTTSNLAHTPFTTEQLTIAANDNITFWSWKKENKNVFKIKQAMCDKYKAAACPKRHDEFTSQVKWVPHSGRMSTTKLSYSLKDGITYDTSHIQNNLQSAPEPPMKAATENKLYGSVDPVHKYVG